MTTTVSRSVRLQTAQAAMLRRQRDFYRYAWSRQVMANGPLPDEDIEPDDALDLVLRLSTRIDGCTDEIRQHVKAGVASFEAARLAMAREHAVVNL